MRMVHFVRLLLCFTMMILSLPCRSQDNSVLQKTVRLDDSYSTIYQQLKKITKQTGVKFVYDSEFINNNERVQTRSNVYSVEDAVRAIVGKNDLGIRMVGKHLLLFRQEHHLLHAKIKTITVKTEKGDSIKVIDLSGRLIDHLTQKPIEYAAIGLEEAAIGTITNQNGEFRLTIPDSLSRQSILFSHIGYLSKKMAISEMADRNTEVALEPKVFPLQEVIVRVVNPSRLLMQMQENIQRNYPQKPTYLTTFYREGVQKDNDIVNYTEAVFKIYKASYGSNSADLVKLLQMRQTSNTQVKDTVVTRMKAGINACILLDLIKNMPDFITPLSENIYRFTSADITEIDGRLVNVIQFEPREGAVPLVYSGQLFIDTESGALLRASFSIPPSYVKASSSMLVEKKSRSLIVTPREVKYMVSYRNWNGRYYISHIRGELNFRIRKRMRMFSGFDMKTWFEMATCKIDTVNVTRFTRNEILPTRTIFSQTHYNYDEAFWGEHNVIIPEENLTEALRKIQSRIEETEGR
jgi:hypothetical protein